jgi:hypothetical protein
MRVASVKPNDLAVVKDDSLILIGDALAVQGLLSKGASMIDFIAHYESLTNSFEGAIAISKKVTLDSNLLKPPVERPSKIWAAAFNYKRGTSDLKDAAGCGETLKFTSDQNSGNDIFETGCHRARTSNRDSPRRADGLSRAGIVCRHRQTGAECFHN